MRVVIQRVSQASVKVGGKVIGDIQEGLLILQGVEDDDDEIDLKWVLDKAINQRIFSDKIGKIKRTEKIYLSLCMYHSTYTY